MSLSDANGGIIVTGDGNSFGAVMTALAPYCRVRLFGDAYWRYLEARAESLVDAHWTEIKSVAGALIERETLKTEEILTVIRSAS